MVEAGAKELPEEIDDRGDRSGHEAIQTSSRSQEQLVAAAGKPKRRSARRARRRVAERGRRLRAPALREGRQQCRQSRPRGGAGNAIEGDLVATLEPKYPDRGKEIHAFFEKETEGVRPRADSGRRVSARMAVA